MRRVAALIGVVAMASLVAGCSGKTTGASEVTRTSARLNAQGSCDQDCSYRFRFARTLDAGWPDRSDSLRPYITDTRSGIGSTHGNTGSYGEAATLLLPDTPYRFQACGRDAGFSDYVCVGPDGTTGTSSTFTTQPGDYVSGSAVVSSKNDTPLASFLVQATGTPSGGSPDGAVGIATRGGGGGGAVTCLRVQGSRAVIGTADTFYFLEDGPGTQAGYYVEAPTNGNAGTCPPVRSSGDALGDMISGIAIHDSP